MKIYKISQINAFHGSDAKIDAFSIGFSGKGHDQEGPGIYFSSSEENASRYGNNTYHVELHFTKTVNKEGEINENEVRSLILGSLGLQNELELENLSEEDFYDSLLSDWAETPYQAFLSAVSSIMNSTDPQDAFQSVWFNFYRYEPQKYLKNVVSLGYDGVIVPKDGVVHYIVFNPQIIEIK